ncbi:MAG: transglycosylase SLT domain-containing protein [Candidatus Hydrogenedentota bacterium]
MNSLLSLALLCSFSLLPGESTFLEAHELGRSGKHADAMNGYIAVAQMDPTLAPYAKLRAANARAMAGDVTGAIRETETVLGEHATGPWVQWAHAQLARLRSRNGDREGAAAHYDYAVKSPVDLWWLDDLRWRAAENDLKIPSRFHDGLNFFRNKVISIGWYPKRLEASRLLAMSDRADDRMQAALGLLRSNKVSEATKVATSIPQTWLTERHLAIQWKRLSARLLIMQGKKTQGQRMLEELALEYPKESWADKALLYTGISLIRAEQWDEADRVMNQLLSAYPDSASAAEGVMRLGQAHARYKHYDRAVEWFQIFVKEFPDRGDAAEALLEAGHTYRSADRDQEALGMYDQLLNDYPYHSAASDAGFWAGSVLLENGQKTLARKRFEKAVQAGLTRYYGFRAQEILVTEFDKPKRKAPNLSITPKASLIRPIPFDAEDPGFGLVDMKHDRRFERLRFFANHGLQEAEWEGLYLLQTLDNHATPELFYRAIGEAGVAYSAMQWANARRFGVGDDGRESVERLRIRYPRPYWSYVSSLGEELDLDPYLILSIARQESTYRPNLTSSAGAKGVLQLMPTTAKWLGDTDPRISKQDATRLEDPQHSLRMGAVYLRQMLDRSDGNVAYALASYNAGPGNFDKWRRRKPNLSVPEFIEEIPFTETRNYVKRILAHYATYKSIYKN